MALAEEDRQILEQHSQRMRRTDPRLHRALSRHRPPTRVRTWVIVYVLACYVAIALGVAGGLTFGGIACWLVWLTVFALLARAVRW